ncbi:hypothetical protein PV433_10260 [Paenibacillus sp. GYB004]|uniref:hypothetical protein n=1 Tax=Paenibacillus sp. GYB004 TaxID=2994393 RepID=UPI002F96A568
MISEKEAWDISKKFSDGIADIIGSHLKVVIVIGSLAGGYYRPGISDSTFAA